jgi:O-antigen biosynthesis protein
VSKIDLIIPSWNLPEYLIPCTQSILKNGDTDLLNRIIVVNNGTPESLNYLTDRSKITVLQQKENMGWEGGLKAGLAVSDTPFVIFMNDDTFIPRSSRTWLADLLKNFSDQRVGGVGPTSNCVMGAQNMGWYSEGDKIETPYLIGYCVMLRREALDKAGGVDDSLPNHGDDIDLSIRIRQQGYLLLADRTVFVFHHGFKSGERALGSYYNSMEMQDKTNHSLIRKHGLRQYLATMVVPQYAIHKNGAS